MADPPTSQVTVSLDALLAEPERAAALSLEERRRVVSRLAAAIVLIESSAPPTSGSGLEPGPPRFVDAATVAARLGVPESWVYDQARRGNLPSIRLGHYVRFAEVEVAGFMAAHRREKA